MNSLHILAGVLKRLQSASSGWQYFMLSPQWLVSHIQYAGIFFFLKKKWAHGPKLGYFCAHVLLKSLGFDRTWVARHLKSL